MPTLMPKISLWQAILGKGVPWIAFITNFAVEADSRSVEVVHFLPDRFFSIFFCHTNARSELALVRRGIY